MCKYTVLAVGGDVRQAYAANELSKLGFKVYTLGVADKTDESVVRLNELCDSPVKFDVIFLPMMTKGDGLDIPAPFSEKKIECEELVKAAGKKAVFLGGMLKTPMIEYFSSMGFDVYDYFRREELILKNCIPTAEGALQIALERTSSTVCGSNVLVTGFGRVGMVTSILFKSVGANVTAAARRTESRARANVLGIDALPIEKLKDCINNFDIVINTTPAMIIDTSLISAMKKSCLIIDLASGAGGVNFKAAEEYDINAVHALSLPGKCAPVTAGKYIAQTVESVLQVKRGD